MPAPPSHENSPKRHVRRHPGESEQSGGRARLSARAGFHITPACRTSLAPLIQGEAYPPCTHGLPDYVRLTNRVVPKKLPTAFTLSTVHGTARVPPEGRDPRSQTLSWRVHRTSRRSRRANGRWATNKPSPSQQRLQRAHPWCRMRRHGKGCLHQEDLCCEALHVSRQGKRTRPSGRGHMQPSVRDGMGRCRCTPHTRWGRRSGPCPRVRSHCREPGKGLCCGTPWLWVGVETRVHSHAGGRTTCQGARAVMVRSRVIAPVGWTATGLLPYSTCQCCGGPRTLPGPLRTRGHGSMAVYPEEDRWQPSA